MNATTFYQRKKVVHTEWWLGTPARPGELPWARLRTFEDGVTDVCFGPDHVTYGFVDAESAKTFLLEDEYGRLEALDDEEKAEYGVTEFTPPQWAERYDKKFKYRGPY